MSAHVSLDARQFSDMMRAGHALLSRAVPSINALNVFPVPDGDTGTNMALSLGAGLQQMDAEPHVDVKSAARALAEGLLMGARGNSGVILSQLLRGFSRTCPARRELDAVLFANALQEGVTIAYQAVSKPVEGTILTVAREAAMAGRKRAKPGQALAEWLAGVVEAAQAALDNTPAQLPVLRQAGVVDSGGQGFVTLLAGWLSWLRGDAAETLDEAAKDDHGARVLSSTQLAQLDAHAHAPAESEFGYCTEVLIRVPGEQTEAESALRERLAQYGDSLLVVRAGNLVKVHVHTVRPGRVLEDALTYGPLVKIKVENMTEQFTAIHGTSHSIGDAGTASSSPASAAAQSPAGPRGDNESTTPVCALVAVAVGKGIEETFQSLGAHRVVSGGQTMNPSTEELVQAMRSVAAETGATEVVLLPNNKNVWMAAEQAVTVFGGSANLVKTADILQGMAAAVAFRPDRTADANRVALERAVAATVSGSVVRATRDTVYQDVAVRTGQYLAFAGGDLRAACDTRLEAVAAALRAMWFPEAELLTALYGDDVSRDELLEMERLVEQYPGLSVELRFGGQPIYDYLLSLE
ncbi:MAG: DAK2 domain-containing protein [Alicyclobacillus sp.]|nr:DAK2 domain-containing protein [Alicyclobacillus sp.]